MSANRRAQEWRTPYIRLLDAQLLREVPVVSAVLGSVAGLPAVNACMAHFTLMVAGVSHLR